MPLTKFQMAMMKSYLIRSWMKVKDLTVATRSGRNTQKVITEMTLSNTNKAWDYVWFHNYVLPMRLANGGNYDREAESDLLEWDVADDPDFLELEAFSDSFADAYRIGARVKSFNSENCLDKVFGQSPIEVEGDPDWWIDSDDDE